MKRMAYVGKGIPTPEESAAAHKAGYELYPVGELSPFEGSLWDLYEYDAIATSHPALAMRALDDIGVVGVFDGSESLHIFVGASRDSEGHRLAMNPEVWREIKV